MIYIDCRWVENKNSNYCDQTEIKSEGNMIVSSGTCVLSDDSSCVLVEFTVTSYLLLMSNVRCRANI